MRLDFREYMALDEAAQVLRETGFLFFEADSVQPTQDRLKYIDPLTRKNWRNADKWRQLAAIVNYESRKTKNPTPRRRIWVTFSDVPRLGMPQAIRSGKSTPYGVFAYPASLILNRVKDGHQGVPYAGDRPYMIVFKVKENMVEIGTKSLGFDRYSKGEFKNDLDTSLERSLLSDLEQKQSDLRSRLENWVYDTKKGKGQPKKELYQIAKKLLTQAITKLVDASNEYPNSVDAANALKGQDIGAMFNPEVIKNKEVAQIKQQLYDYISGLTYNYNGLQKYKDINIDDMSVELTSDYKTFLQSGRSALTPEDLAKEPDLEGRKSLEWVLQFDKKISGYSYGRDYIQQYQKLQSNEGKLSPYDSPYLKKMLSLMVKDIRKTLENYHELPFDKVNYPMKPELGMLASKYGVDIKTAVQTAIGDSDKEPMNGKQFIYRTVEAMAKQAAINQKNKSSDDEFDDNTSTSWQPVWAKMLRLIGWDHVVDTMHTGQIHTSEPTQGAFMDTTKIEQIGLIVNSSHVGHEDKSQRPSLTDPGGWQPQDGSSLRSGQHSRTQGPERLRKGPAAGGLGNPAHGGYRYNSDSPVTTDKTAFQRTLMNLNYRLEQFVYSLKTVSEKPPNQIGGWMVMLIKLLKTSKKVKETAEAQEPVEGEGPPRPSVASRSGIRSSISKMGSLFRQINQQVTAIKAARSTQFSVMTVQQLDNVLQLTTPDAKNVTTPHYSRPLWRQPEFQKVVGEIGPQENEALSILAATHNKSGYYVNLAYVTDLSDDHFYGPFITHAAAVTACVLVGDKGWQYYWKIPKYFSNYQAVEKVEMIKPVTMLKTKTPASREEIQALFEQIKAESESAGY